MISPAALLRTSIVTLVALASFGVQNKPATAATYTIDTSHTAAMFRVKHLGISYMYGQFNHLSGVIHFDPADLKGSGVTVVIKTSSIFTANRKRDQHLKGPDFLDVKRYPTATFKSTSVRASGKNQYAVTGDLTLHGVTRRLTLPLTHTGQGKDPWGGYRIGFETTFTIKRSDYGMKYMLGGLGDSIRLIVGLQATRKK